MHQLEAFTLGKKYGQPDTNEDSLVIMPGRGYAVIDGVTDRNGTRYGRMLSGQFASRTVQRAIEEFLLAQGQSDQPKLQFQGGAHFVEHVSRAIRDGYAAYGALEAAEADWTLRGGCTVMAAMLIGDRLEVVAVGDSGLRINGSETLQVLKPLDDVTAILRRESWHHFAALGWSVADCERLAAAFTWNGTRNQPEGSETAAADLVETIERQALAACVQHLPQVPQDEMLVLIQHGIAHGQGRFQNTIEPALGYGSIDGFAVPAGHIETRSYAIAEIETLELFSDGYFAPGATFGVAAWEAMFATIEGEDPHKIGRYMSTKGTTETQWTDDRTYLGVCLT